VVVPPFLVGTSFFDSIPKGTPFSFAIGPCFSRLRYAQPSPALEIRAWLFKPPKVFLSASRFVVLDFFFSKLSPPTREPSFSQLAGLDFFSHPHLRGQPSFRRILVFPSLPFFLFACVATMFPSNDRPSPCLWLVDQGSRPLIGGSVCRAGSSIAPHPFQKPPFTPIPLSWHPEKSS